MSSPQQTFTPRVILQLLIFIVAVPLLPILITGRWGWWEAWAYALINILGFAVSRALAARRHPDLLAERARFTDHADAKPWDKVLAPLTALGGTAILVVAGLDVRFGRSPAFDLGPKVVALLLILAGYALGSYALLANRFFSGMVRIQTERGHQAKLTMPAGCAIACYQESGNRPVCYPAVCRLLHDVNVSERK